MRRRTRIVALEGLDGMGKSTLTEYARQKSHPVYRFERFPGQNDLNSPGRWEWLDYLHVQVAKALDLFSGEEVVFFDRSIASNVVTRWFAEGKQGTVGDYASLALWHRSEAAGRAREAEALYHKAGMTVALLRPSGGYQWVAERNVLRPDEPEWTSDTPELQRMDALYSIWRLSTPMTTLSIPVERSDSTETVYRRIMGGVA